MMLPADFSPRRFWSDVTRLGRGVDRVVFRRVLAFGIWAALFTLVENLTVGSIAVDVTPYELAGAALSLLLVLRTNAGYERWWEARKLWGGIVNNCRDLVIVALANGPREARWREEIVRWTAAFPHAVRISLRGESRNGSLVLEQLLGSEPAAKVLRALHPPTFVIGVIATKLAEAERAGTLSGFAFLQADRSRAALVDHLGGCERIQSTPLPQAYSEKIRQLLTLFLLALPFALVSRVGWLTPLVAMLVAYPILAIDEIGDELQQPFQTASLNHLPLDEICARLEQNLLAQLSVPPVESTQGTP